MERKVHCDCNLLVRPLCRKKSNVQHKLLVANRKQKIKKAASCKMIIFIGLNKQKTAHLMP
jgi:hypothetical protein